MTSLSGRLQAIAMSIALALVALPSVAAVKNTGGAVAKITVITETNAQSTSSTSFVDLPGASATITVPALKTQLVNVRFSAESYCFSSTATGWCSVRILADGVEMKPNSGEDFAFDASGNADDFWEGHAMERTILLGAGTHTIDLQWVVTDPSIFFRLDDWTMAITQYSNGH